MSKKKNYNRRAGTPSLIGGLSLALIAAVAALFVSYFSNKGETQTQVGSNSSSSQILINSSDNTSEQIKSKPIERDGLEIRYIDVDQGDCSLIMLPDGKNVLIDAGPNSSADYVVEYLKKANIEKIDFLIATHPHEDHIGGMDEVINNFEIGRVYAPKIESSKTNDSTLPSDTESSKDEAVVTTKTYENFLKAVSDKGLKIINGKGGTHVYFSLSLTIDIIAPNSEKYSDVNNYSLVVKMKYGQQSFLFMGDAENYSEQEIIDNDYDLNANVIKIGHHGSTSSSSKSFIKNVNPQYAVISCGKDNKYNHPHDETLKTLEENEVKVFRTDENGTITLKSDGLSELLITEEREKQSSSSSEISNESSEALAESSESSDGLSSENSVESSLNERVA